MRFGNGADSVQAGVLEAQQLFWIALKTKDSDILEDILAEDFILRSPGQPNQSRTEFIRTLTSFPVSISSVDCDNLEINYYSNVAVLSGVQVAHLQFHDSNTMLDVIAITNIFHYIGKQWLMVLSHTVELPTTPSNGEIQ